MKKHNFNPGPSILPRVTVEKTAQAILDLNGSGLSLMEVSHRSKDFLAVIQEAQKLMKELLGVPEGYSVIFLGGGASLQFSMVPFNLFRKKAAYLNTGYWASKAIKEARVFGEVVEVASSKDKNYNYIPKNYTVPGDADYLHITTNNTIFGTEIKNDPDVKIPLVADMSSDFLSRPVDVSRYAIIYAGAQKNLGPAGVTAVIVRNDVCGKMDRAIPSMLDYKVHIENESLYNTPPVVPIYAALITMQWLKELGGLSVIQQRNREKARLLYDEIVRNKLFKATVENEEDRSVMNICFVMEEKYKELEEPFAEFAGKNGMVGIKGHRSVGGFRASTYNALPKESIMALVDIMKEFERKNL